MESVYVAKELPSGHKIEEDIELSPCPDNGEGTVSLKSVLKVHCRGVHY